MDRSAAVTRIKRGLGFLTGTAHDDVIVSALQEAQRELEKGKTLPKFLLQEDQTISLAAGDSDAPLPTGFIRTFDDEKLHFVSDDSTIPIFMLRRLYGDAVLAYQRYESGAVTATTSRPKVYVIRKETIDFISPTDAAYSIIWSYFKKGATLETDIENEWLANEPEWLIGEAGMRIAADLRDMDAVSIFMKMRDIARASHLAEIFAGEEADGPFQMGVNN